MSALKEAYFKYWKDRSHQTIEALWENIKAYDQHPFINITPPGGDDWIRIGSSGSTGIPSKYCFGPAFKHWVNIVESHLRSVGLHVLDLAPRWFTKYHSRLTIDPGVNHRADSYFNGDLRNPAAPHAIMELYEEKGPLAIMGNPCQLSFIMQAWPELFKDGIIGHLINHDDDILLTKDLKTPINDQMIDWQSGYAFRNCDYGHRHVLPITNGTINLLNMSWRSNGKCSKPSDHLQVKMTNVKCKCGLPSQVVDFIPHYANQIIINGKVRRPFDMLHNLKTIYHVLQVRQVEPDKIIIHYITHGSEAFLSDDLEVLRECWRPANVEFQAGTWWRTGSKIPRWWRGPGKTLELI